MAKFAKLYFIIFAAYCLITIAANNVLIAELLKLLNEPVNPLIVHFYTIACISIGIPVAAVIAMAFNKADHSDVRIRYYYSILIVAHILFL